MSSQVGGLHDFTDFELMPKAHRKRIADINFGIKLRQALLLLHCAVLCLIDRRVGV